MALENVLFLAGIAIAMIGLLFAGYKLHSRKRMVGRFKPTKTGSAEKEKTVENGPEKQETSAGTQPEMINVNGQPIAVYLSNPMTGEKKKVSPAYRLFFRFKTMFFGLVENVVLVFIWVSVTTIISFFVLNPTDAYTMNGLMEYVREVAGRVGGVVQR